MVAVCGLLLLSWAAFLLANRFAENLVELPHYHCLLVVREGVLGLTALGLGARLDQGEPTLTRIVPVPKMSSGLAR